MNPMGARQGIISLKIKDAASLYNEIGRAHV